MRKLFVLLVALLLVSAASHSEAGTFNVDGTLSVTLGTLPEFTTTNSLTGVTTTGGDFSLPAGIFNTTVTIPPTDLLANQSLISKLTFVGIVNQTGSFAGGQGVMGLGGSAHIEAGGGFIVGDLGLSQLGAGGPANPLAPVAFMGNGGFAPFGPCTRATTAAPTGNCDNTLLGNVGGLDVFATAGGWTTGTATISRLNTLTDPANTATNAPRTNTRTQKAVPGDARTAGGGGRIQFVSPLRVALVEDNHLLGTGLQLGAFVVLTLDFVPEPGTLVLFGSGALGLALIGLRRRK